MARCYFCFHRDRDKIDALYVQGTGYRAIIRTFGGSLGSASRHAQHIKDLIKELAPAERVERCKSLMDRLEDLIAEAQDICKLAKADKSYAAATNALNSVARALELLGKLSGEIAQPVNAPGLHISMNRITNVSINGNDDAELAALTFEALESLAVRGFDHQQATRLRALAETAGTSLAPTIENPT